MLFFVLFITFLFDNASFTEAQQSGRATGIISGEECGIPTAKSRSFVAGGRSAVSETLPWQAGVYSRRTNPLMQVCGGSVVSTQVVISAAHCFWNEVQMQLPATDFAVAAGKIYRPWNDMMDIYAQKSDIREIHIPPRFHGATTNFQDDIALLILTTPFSITRFVRPVCLDFDYSMDRKQLTDGNLGKVAGWGRTDENAKASPTLQVVDLPFVDVQRCYDSVEPVFRPAITSDKICAGNNTGGTAVCMGDSGGGLIFPEMTPKGNRYYLRGVVSTAPRSVDDNLCNIYTYATFTHILKHEHFIREVMLEVSAAAAQSTQKSTSGNSVRLSAPSDSQELLDIPSSETFPKAIVTDGTPESFSDEDQIKLEELARKLSGTQKSNPDTDEQINESTRISDIPVIPSNSQEVSPPGPTSEPFLTKIITGGTLKTPAKEGQMRWLADTRSPRGKTEESEPDAVEEEPTPKPLSNGPEQISTGLIRPDSPDSDADEEQTPRPLSVAPEEISSGLIRSVPVSPDPDTVVEKSATEDSLSKDPEDSTSQSRTTQSDPNAVKVMEDLGSSALNTSETERPYLSTASKPFLSTEKKPVPSENQPAKSEVTQKIQSTPNLPMQNTEKKKPKSIGGLPSPSAENQPKQSKGISMPLSTGHQLPLTRQQPSLSTGSRPVHFTKSYPTTYTLLSNPDITYVTHRWQPDLGLFNYYRYNAHHTANDDYPRGYHHQGLYHQGYNAWQGQPYNQW